MNSKRHSPWTGLASGGSNGSQEMKTSGPADGVP